MPMQDAALALAVSQVVTATALCQNVVDIGTVRDVGAGQEVFVEVQTEATALAGGAATLTLQLLSSPNSDLSSPTILAQSDAIPKASLTVGTRIGLAIPRSFINQLGQRYLGLNFVVATGPFTQGTWSAYLVSQLTSNGGKPPIYASGWSVR